MERCLKEIKDNWINLSTRLGKLVSSVTHTLIQKRILWYGIHYQQNPDIVILRTCNFENHNL